MLDTRPAQALEAILRLMPCLDKALTDDNYAGRAAEDLRRVRSQPEFSKTLYMLYGHTHRAAQIPVATPQNSACQVYLNTGTWRPLYRQTLDQQGLMRWKNLTFTLFYCARHDPYHVDAGQEPTFETWTGSLLEPPRFDPRQLPDPC